MTKKTSGIATRLSRLHERMRAGAQLSEEEIAMANWPLWKWFGHKSYKGAYKKINLKPRG